MPWGPVVAFLVFAALLGSKFGSPLAGCNIKGNISFTTGERIYHTPGQLYDDATLVNPLKGERRFCSEQAARDAGWRRARI